MLQFLRDLELGRYSFWIGFLAGILFWWFLGTFRVYLSRLRKEAKTVSQTAKRGLTSNVEIRFRNDVLRKAQRSHLTSLYFSLDEILIPPRLIAPPALAQPGVEAPDLDIVSKSVPYLPDWPELAAVYKAPTLTITEALQEGANLILLGNPGSGKTVTLSHLASILARRDEAAGPFRDFLPILVHASDIVVASHGEDDLIKVLSNAVGEYASALSLTRLPSVLRTALEKGSAIVLVDGVDELAPDSIDQVVNYLDALLGRFQSIRIVASASLDYYDGLTQIGLVPIPLAGWGEEQKTAFLAKWSELWGRHVVVHEENPEEDVDPKLLTGWLMDPNPYATPLEITLKTWAAYAGDLLGSTAPDAIEAYLLRMTVGISKARPVLERIATQMLLGLTSAITQKEAQKSFPMAEASVSPFEETASPFEDQIIPIEQEAPLDQDSTPAQAALVTNLDDQVDESPVGQDRKKTTGRPGQKVGSFQQVIPDLLSNGLLIPHLDYRVSFIHPVIAGYLAGTALASSGNIENVKNQPVWTGKNLTMHYLAYWNDMTDHVTPIFEHTEDPLFRDLLRISHWLRDAPKNVRWRPQAMRHLASFINREVYPIGLRARLLSALISSGDPGVPLLLRQSLTNPLSSVRQIAALGCGLIRDSKAVDDLVILIEDSDEIVSHAALLALVAIANKPAMDAVATVLLEGTEDLRRAAAEALANHLEEGHPALEEGSAMEDLLVRRAVVFGLARVRESWALDRLAKMQVEDSQWAVQSAATQVLEEMRRPNPRVPRPLPPLTQLPWLIVYAGKQGLGVAPGEPAKELVISALRSEDAEERLAALDYLRLKGEEPAVPNIYQLYYGGEDRQREAACNALWHMACAGIHLPPPTQYGLS